MPCLNEADTLATCIRKALTAMRHAGIAGEVVVADNGSTDDSPAIATAEGARLVPVADRGYGAALMGGIEAAHGRFVIMGDADDSYDFGEVPTFVERLREGYDLVQGCRLESGGGRVLPGAMPRLHRWLGNPMFSRIARRWFRAPVHDIYCGLRGFTKALYQTLDQRCTGMEFATEMIIKASLLGRAHRRGADHAAPRRPQESPAAPEDVSRRLAHAALLPDVHAAPALPAAGADPRRAGPRRIHGGHAGHDDRAA